jgi:hypothetical protein
MVFAAMAFPAKHAVIAESLNEPFAFFDGCDIDCEDGGGCDAGWHDAWNTTPNFYFWTRNGGQHSYTCYEGTCDTKHGPQCNPVSPNPITTAELEQLRLAIVSHNVQQVAAIVGNHKEELKLNPSRAAVQRLNCKGHVIMHLPLGQDLMHELAAL